MTSTKGRKAKVAAFLGLLVGACSAMAAAVAHASPRLEGGWRMAHDASVDGHRIDWLIHVTGIFVTILFVIMVIWMVWAVLRFGEKHTAQYDHGDGRKAITVALSISALIFFVVDGNLFYNSVVDLHEVFWNFDYAEAQPGAVRIEVNAHQWAWDARYPGPDGQFNTRDDIVTLNDIRVPVGTPVVLQLASNDVIHSFYLPNFRIKQDAMPGMINRMWFRARETGEFDIACAQHCGVNHYKMRGTLTVLSRAAYDRWAADASGDSARRYDPNDADGHWGWSWMRRP